MTAPSVSRDQVVAAARGWIGTPYRHQASLKGVGCDCLGLLRGVWRELYGAEPEAPGPYTRNWAEESGAEHLRDAARRHLREIAAAEFRAGGTLRPGSVLLIRVRDRGPAKHAAIAVAPAAIVHAFDGHAVAENALPAAWRRRIAFAFDFPGLTE